MRMDLDKDQVGGKRASTFVGSVKQSFINMTARYSKNVKKCISEIVYIQVGAGPPWGGGFVFGS